MSDSSEAAKKNTKSQSKKKMKEAAERSRLYRERYRKENAERMRLYRQKHREKINQRRKERKKQQILQIFTASNAEIEENPPETIYEQHLKAHSERQHRYYERHKEEINRRRREERQKQITQKIPTTTAERNRNYREKYRLLINERRRNSRRLKQNSLTECNNELDDNELASSSNDEIKQEIAQTSQQQTKQHFEEIQTYRSIPAKEVLQKTEESLPDCKMIEQSGIERNQSKSLQSSDPKSDDDDHAEQIPINKPRERQSIKEMRKEILRRKVYSALHKMSCVVEGCKAKENQDESLTFHREEELKELNRKRNCERQRAYYYRQKDLKKTEKKIPKSNAERQREFRQRRKRQKLDSNEENVVQCRAVENIENVTLQENQFHSQQLQIYVLHRNTGIPGDESLQDYKMIEQSGIERNQSKSPQPSDPKSDDDDHAEQIPINKPRESQSIKEMRKELLKIEQRKLQILEAEVVQSAALMKSDNYQFLMSLLPEMEKLPSVHKMRLRMKIGQAVLDEVSSLEQEKSNIQLIHDPDLSVDVKEEPINFHLTTDCD